MPGTTGSKMSQYIHWPPEYLPCARLKPALSLRPMLSQVHTSFGCKECRRQLHGACHILHEVCVPAALNHSLEELVLPVAL